MASDLHNSLPSKRRFYRPREAGGYSQFYGRTWRLRSNIGDGLCAGYLRIPFNGPLPYEFWHTQNFGTLPYTWRLDDAAAARGAIRGTFVERSVLTHCGHAQTSALRRAISLFSFQLDTACIDRRSGRQLSQREIRWIL